jgi:hypothetical protein
MKSDRIDVSQATPDEQPSSAEKRDTGEPIEEHSVPTPPGGIDKLQPPPPSDNKPKTNKKHRYTRDHGMFWISVATLIVVAVYAWCARQQAIETARAAKAAKESASAATDAVKVAEETLKTQKDSVEKTLFEMKSQSKAMEISANATKSQAESSKRANKIAEETLHIVEAADLEPDHIHCSTVPETLSLKTEIALWYRNSGRTRAVVEDLVLYVGIPEGPIREPRGEPFKAIVAAGQSVQSGPVFVGKATNELTLALINDGTLKMHLWSWVIYRDVFGVQHRVDFDAIYTPKTQCDFYIIRAIAH